MLIWSRVRLMLLAFDASGPRPLTGRAHSLCEACTVGRRRKIGPSDDYRLFPIANSPQHYRQPPSAAILFRNSPQVILWPRTPSGKFRGSTQVFPRFPRPAGQACDTLDSMAHLTRSDGLPVPDDAEERLLELFEDSPLNDAPLTPEQRARVDRFMERIRREVAEEN